MQIKKWGPEAGRLDNYIREDTLCHEEDQSCFDNPSEGSPYGDFGWWTQNNGHRCDLDRAYCIDKNGNKLDNTNICNWPRGTDGQQFHPYVKKEERLWIFQTDICRSLYMDYV